MNEQIEGKQQPHQNPIYIQYSHTNDKVNTTDFLKTLNRYYSKSNSVELTTDIKSNTVFLTLYPDTLATTLLITSSFKDGILIPYTGIKSSAFSKLFVSFN